MNQTCEMEKASAHVCLASSLTRVEGNLDFFVFRVLRLGVQG